MTYKTRSYAVMVRESRPLDCAFIESESAEEAVRSFCHEWREIHVLDGDKVRIFRVTMGAVEVMERRTD